MQIYINILKLRLQSFLKIVLFIFLSIQLTIYLSTYLSIYPYLSIQSRFFYLSNLSIYL